MRRTEMADHSLESLEHLKDRTVAYIFLKQKIMIGNDFMHLKVVSKFQLNAKVTMWIRRICYQFWQVSNVFLQFSK